MSLMTQAIIADKYSLRLTVDQLAEALQLGKSTVYNQVSAKTFPIPTYVEAGKRFADFRDVAGYLDECRARATCYCLWGHWKLLSKALMPP
jgi:predicted DNA-binding transcriptional regulator AlpA